MQRLQRPESLIPAGAGVLPP